MPTSSAHPPISIPPVDLWTFLFERPELPYPDDHVIYHDVSESKRYTYRDIRASALNFGRGLAKHWSWQKGSVLAVFSPNNAEWASVIWGTHWAGGIVCPFNNTYTVEELATQLKSSNAKALVTHASCLKTARAAMRRVGLGEDRILLLGDQRDPTGAVRHFSKIGFEGEGGTRPVLNPKEDLAFLVYSSGTTGLPKGVMLTHENMVANLIQSNAMDGHLMTWKDDSLIGFLPIYHIYGLAVLLHTPVYRGIPVVIMQRFDLEQFCSLIQQHKTTLAYVVPPVLLLLAKHPLVSKYNLSSLRIMHSSAAPLTEDLAMLAYKRLKVPIKQGYGLSEASPGVSSQPWDEWNKPIGSVGRLISSITVKFIRSDGKSEAAVGEEGEIWLKGPNIFKGYYNNPTATSASLTPDGYFRTGDIGYVDANSNIFITDRLKELIKYNGFQVAPAQLEGLLHGHPYINDVAVIGVYDPNRATELPRAYVVPAPGVDVEGAEGVKKGEEVTEWLAARTAPYKRLRGGVRWVKEIPKSAAGKVLRRTLSDQAKREAEKIERAKL